MTKNPSTFSRERRSQPFPSRLSPLAALVGLALLAANPAHAADDKLVAQLQEEIARLKQALDQSRQELAQKTAVPTAAPVIAAAAAPAPAAPAEVVPEETQTLDAVVIRSRNRIERLQDVPLSVSVVTGKELERLGATDISALTKRAGNISWNYGNQRTSSLSIRGIGKQGQTEAQDPAVGLIVDGVSYAYNALSSSFDFTDIDTLEVARGPQGTLLGKNASIGAVTVTTKRPSFTPSADYSVTIGQNNATKGSLAAGGPLIDGLLAWRGTFSASKQRGDIVNQYNPDLTYTNTDRLSGKVQFLLTPTPDLSARIILDSTPRASEFTNGRTVYTRTPTAYADGSINTLSTDNATRLARRWFSQQNYRVSDYQFGGADGSSVTVDGARPLVTGSQGLSAEVNWNLGSHTLTSITASKRYHFNAVNDEGTPFDVSRNSGGFWNDYRQLSQEFRISSKQGGFVDYQAGLFFMDVKNTNDYRKIWGNDAGAWFATSTQYNRLDKDGAGRYLLVNSLAGLSMSYNSPTGYQEINNRSNAIFAQANWHLSEPLTITTGLRLTQENRQNQGSSSIKDNGNGAELNPEAVNGVVLGGFASSTAGALNASNSAAQLKVADYVANKYFGTAITATPGQAYNSLSAAQKQQVADAKAIRAGQLGVLFNSAAATPFKKVQPSYVISPTYKFSENLTVYGSLQHGEKAGVSQFTNGISNPVKGEKTTAWELGFKSALLDKTLIFNADVYLMDVKDYQQTTQVKDDYSTAIKNDGTISYTNATGNVPKVRSKGLEVDGVYSGIANTNIRFSGAYTDARYVEFKNSALPVEWNYTGNPFGSFRDVSGKTLPGAAKVTYNIGVDYRKPVFGNREFHSSVNVAYTSKWNSDVALSDYAWVPASYITDLSVGVGAINRSFDVSFLVKNVFNNGAHLAQTWNSYTPATPRWIGLVFTGKL